ncbi:uncharacterized protein LOC135707109 [Ochlerotatus camptorhynchus]|uniref:uncharacterized protein LOC135707109 n=1 Tax=Ochlerotatus camptorhynchus TaxID=644619 RepID=UPI0031E174C4
MKNILLLMLRDDFFFEDDREFGVHPINQKRQIYGEYHHLYPDLVKHPAKFRNYTRMRIETFNYVLGLIEERLTKQWTNFVQQPILPREKLIITLRFFATGVSFYALSYSFRIGRSTAAEIVKETSLALWETLQPIHMPPTTEQCFKQIAQDYWEMWNFPNCIGSIDGKHIRIRCPSNSGTMFYNYKHYFSIVLQGVADANCKFISVEVGGYGKQSDGGTFNASTLFKLMETGALNIPQDAYLPGTNTSMPYVFLADEAYPLLQHVLRPYARRDGTADEEYFNSRLSRARKSVECAFGAINAKWRLLWKPIETDPEVAELIVKAICVLHNVIIDKEGYQSIQADGEGFLENNKKVTRQTFNHSYRRTGKQIRDTFRDFVCSTKELE